MSVEKNIPSGWVETTLGEVSKVQTGPFGSQLLKEQYITGGTPVVTVEHIVDFRITDIEYPSVTDEDKKRLSKYLLKEGDIIFTRVGSVDLSAYVAKKQNGWMFSSRMLSVRTNSDVDSKFLSYFFRQNSFRKYIHRISVGATMPSINTNILKSIPISYPPKSEQQAIASILTTFDDKIELLQAQNETLEATAQTIFKEWFGKYQVGDELPEGWRVGELESFLDFLEGPGIRNWQYTENGNRFINIRLIQNGDINVKNANCVSSEEANGKYSHFQLKEKDFVLSTSGTLGRGAIVRKEHLPLLLNTSVIRFRPKDGLSYGYTYQFLQSSYFLHELESLASGSVQLNFGPMHLRQIVMVLPNGQKLEEFSKKVNPLYDKIIHNFSHIQTLQATRDTLLPKLMSGKVRVDEFKE